MKKVGKTILTGILALTCAVGGAISLTGCNGGAEKNITVVARELGSGTREAFDTKVTDGEHFLEEKDANGKKVYNTSKAATELGSTGAVLSTVSSDRNAIGYISLGSVNDTINVVKVNGVSATKETVLDGSYQIQRPFVVMTNKTIELTERTADFLSYLKSEASEAVCDAVGTVFVKDPSVRANEGAEPIPLVEYEKKSAVPAGDKIAIQGSTSMEKFIMQAAKNYATLYGVNAEDLFQIELNGSSEGKKAAENDKKGNVIGLSSSSYSSETVESFNVCLDAVAVIVNAENTTVTDLTLKQLYDIFSGKVTKFSELN